MSTFTLHTPESAREPPLAMLQGARDKMGFVPHMYASAPTTLTCPQARTA